MNHVSPEKTTVNHEDTNGVKDLDVEEIVLKKGNSPLGFSIVGGSDHASHPFGMDEPGIFISKVSSANKPRFWTIVILSVVRANEAFQTWSS